MVPWSCWAGPAAGCHRVGVRYEPRRSGAVLPWVLVAGFSALAVPGTYELLADGGLGGALWVSLRLVALAYVVDRLLVRTAVWVEVDDEGLRWRAPLREGRAALGDLEGFRGARGLSQWQVLDLAGQRSLYVEAMRGVGALADELGRRCPGVPVSLGSRARRLEGRTG